MNEKTKVVCSGGGIGVGTIVWIVLIILKATNHIAMGWFWVLTSIVWANLAILALVFIAIAVIVLISIALS